MSGIGPLLHLAALFERGQAAVEIARNIGAGDPEDTASTQREPTGAGSLAEADASPDTLRERAGARPAALSLAGLTQPPPSLGMDAEKAAQLLLMLNGLTGAVGARAPLLPSAGMPAPQAADDDAAATDAPMEQTTTARAGLPPGLSAAALMAAALAASRAIAAADHPQQDGPAQIAGDDDATAGASLFGATRDAAASAATPPSAMPSSATQSSATQTSPPPPSDAAASGEANSQGLPLARLGAGSPTPPGLEAMLRAVVEAGIGAGLGSGDAPGLQTERAGVIASFILNAAMLPGWPERRFLPATPFTDALARQQAVTDDDIEAYLASLGLPRQGAETAESARQAQRRRRILAYLTMLVAQLVGALDAIEAELRTLADSAIDCADLPEHLRTRMSL